MSQHQGHCTWWFQRSHQTYKGTVETQDWWINWEPNWCSMQGLNLAPTWSLVTTWEACYLLQVHFEAQIQNIPRYGCVSCLILPLTSKIFLALIFHQPHEQCCGYWARVLNLQHPATSSCHEATLFCLPLWCPWWHSWQCHSENGHLHHSKWFIVFLSCMHWWIPCQQCSCCHIGSAWCWYYVLWQNIWMFVWPVMFCQIFYWSWDEQTSGKKNGHCLTVSLTLSCEMNLSSFDCTWSMVM